MSTLERETKSRPDTRSNASKADANGEIYTVCGMKVDPAKAVHEEHDGKTYYFCSPGCASKFRDDPGRYLQPQLNAMRSPESAPSAKPQSYTCPMPPDVHSDGQGACPKCGMTLEPATMTAPSTHTHYTCPMHPQIIRDEPGNCPVCGMTLEPMTETVNAANPELDSMTRRFWIGAALTLPLLAIMVSYLLPNHPVQGQLKGPWLGWFELAFAYPVVFWGGWPFFQWGWASIVSCNRNILR